MIPRTRGPPNAGMYSCLPPFAFSGCATCPRSHSFHCILTTISLHSMPFLVDSVSLLAYEGTDYCRFVQVLSSCYLITSSLVARNHRLNPNISYKVSDRLSPKGTLHSLVVSEPMDIETLDQPVDLVELLLAEADRSRCQVLQNTTLLTK